MNAKPEPLRTASGTVLNSAARIIKGDLAYTTPIATYYRCWGCGAAFKGERGLRSHQSRKFIAAACDYRVAVKPSA